MTLRADSAFYSKAVLATAVKFDVRFSITARQDKRIRAAIEAIDESAWTPIPYWLSTPEVSGADVAETTYTAFAGTKDARTVRLIVRRARPTPGSQLALFTSHDYHAFVTDRTGPTLDTEADHRRHAIVEQSIAEPKSAGLAHLPSSNFMANAAWLALTVMAHNLARSVGLLAGGELHRATATTLRRAVVTIPGRLVTSARQRRLRLPTGWPWADQFTTALDAITAIPSRCRASRHRPLQPGDLGEAGRPAAATCRPRLHRHQDQLSDALINSKRGGGSGLSGDGACPVVGVAARGWFRGGVG